MVDLVEEDGDVPVPIVGIELEVGVDERREVGGFEWEQAIVLEVDVDGARPGQGGFGPTAEALEDLEEVLGLTGAAWARDHDGQGGHGRGPGVRDGLQAPFRKPQVPPDDAGRGGRVELPDEGLEDVFSGFHRRRDGRGRRSGDSYPYFSGGYGRQQVAVSCLL